MCSTPVACDHSDERAIRLWFAAWLGRDGRLALTADDTTAARPRFHRRTLYLPGLRPDIRRAAVAHFHAHCAYGGPAFAPGALRPVQRVLVGLFEDARVEQLALRDRPGLRRLWTPHIDALDAPGTDVDSLLQRLVATLFTPDRPATHPWLEKARRLFASRRSDWHDPQLSRELGNLLGNDLGQMRLQFNHKTWVMQPAYRDDHYGLWEDAVDPEPDTPQQAALRLDATATAVARAPGADGTTAGAGPGEELAPGATAGDAALSLPEWDYARAFYRTGWVAAATYPAGAATPAQRARLDLASHHLRRLPAADPPAPPTRRRFRRSDRGDQLDLDACIRALIDRRAGYRPDTRVWRRPDTRPEPGSRVILIDTSASMGDVVGPLTQLEYAAALATQIIDADTRRGDRVAVYGFCSDGRLGVRLTRVKAFDEGVNADLRSRLAALAPAWSSRRGAALRFAGELLTREPGGRRAILVLTDGEVGDIDCVDPRYLPADAERAAAELHERGIAVHIRLPASAYAR